MHEAHPTRSQYLYQYAHAYAQSNCPDDYFDPEYGVTHTAELSYVFGQPLYLFGAPSKLCTFSTEEQKFADEVGALWGGFARSATVPNSWPAYDAETDMDARIDEGGSDGTGLNGTESRRHSDACDLWDERARSLWPSP
jgi:carboxylesterase type B